MNKQRPWPEAAGPGRMGRRRFLVGVTGLTTGLLVAGCRDGSSEARPSSVAGTGTSAAGTAGESGNGTESGNETEDGNKTKDGAAATVASLVKLRADPSFRFAADLTNRGAGELAPVAADYYLSKYLVTNARYAEFLAATAGSAPDYWSDGAPPSGKDEHPVLSVSATDAMAYCAWLSSQTSGWAFRLPTEAEWERAARGARQASYPWGEESGTTYRDGRLTSKFTYNGVVSAQALADGGNQVTTYSSRSSLAGQSVRVDSILSVGADGSVRGWIDHDSNTGFVFTELFEKLSANGGYTTAVGAHRDGASSDGLLDLAGNAFEWTSSVVTASNGAEAGKSVNAVRGGSWYATSRSCTTTYRGEGRAPEGRYSTVGFRVAADPA